MLGGEFLVLRNGDSVGRPPAESVAVLLLALLGDHPDWSDRARLAKDMYPGSEITASQAAFRVALCRLRDWIGEDAIESAPGRIRLAGEWSVDRSLTNGEMASGCRIAPGINHPIAEEVRRLWSGHQEIVHSDIAESFINSVTSAAATDPDFARSLLVSGFALIESIQSDVVRSLLTITRPKRSEDPFVPEYLDILAIQSIREGDFQTGNACLARGYKLAMRTSNRQAAMRLGYRSVYALIESGFFDEAAEMLAKVEALQRANEYLVENANARATLAWNANKFELAQEQMAQVAKSIDSATRFERLHFLSNYAVFTSELGNWTLTRELQARGAEEAKRGTDKVFWFNYDLVQASEHLASGDVAEGLQFFEGLHAQAKREANPLSLCYALEWQGEAYAKLGKPAKAGQLFNKMRSTRKSIGCRTNPRTLARIERATV